MPSSSPRYTTDAPHTTDMSSTPPKLPAAVTPTVYLIAQPTVSRDPGANELKLAPLAEWGRVQVLILPGEDPRYNPQLALKRIRTRLAEFDPELDYLVWAGGDTLAAVLVGIVLADFAGDEEDPFETFTWLRWDRGQGRNGRTDVGGRYVPIKVSLFTPNTDMVPDPHDGNEDDD